ncbi:MAG: hypothetical protein QM755_20530 [Luteolibacter sp.]
MAGVRDDRQAPLGKEGRGTFGERSELAILPAENPQDRDLNLGKPSQSDSWAPSDQSTKLRPT